MQFGICTSVEDSAAAKAAGWDFIEVRVDQFIQGLLPNVKWKGVEIAKESVLPIIAGNVLVPPALKITGPAVNTKQLRDYLATVMRRAEAVGIKTLVFGSGGARNVPGGFDRAEAQKQITQFLKLLSPIAKVHGITIVIEHLNHMECNIINTIDEAMEYVTALNDPTIRCLADTFHFWLNEEKLDSLERALPAIAHVHVSDSGRKIPGTLPACDYRSFFAVIKNGGYDGPISVESVNFNVAEQGEKVLAFLKDQWDRC